MKHVRIIRLRHRDLVRLKTLVTALRTTPSDVIGKGLALLYLLHTKRGPKPGDS